MENDKKLNMFKETWEEIQKIKKDKTIPYREKGKLMAGVVIEKYNLKHPLYLVDFIKKIFIDDSQKGFEIEVKDLAQEKEDEYKGPIFGRLVSKSRSIIISDKIPYLQFQRFTIAHEIAHIFIDSKKGQNDNFQLKNDIYYQHKNNCEELVYNDFAANLLVVDSVVNPNGFCDIFEITSVWKMFLRYKVPIKELSILYEQISEKRAPINGKI